MRELLRHIFALILMTFATAPCHAIDMRSMRHTLEHSLQQRDHYFATKVEAIEAKEQSLLQTNDKRKRFEICYEIFDLSRSYKYDTAYKYANEALNIALELGDADLICRAQACKISTFTSGGLFTEAADVIRSASTYGVSDASRRELYYNIIRHYSDQRDYASESEYKAHYTQLLRSYTDSLLALSPTVDYYSAYARCYQQLVDGDIDAMVDDLRSFYGSVECSPHHNSIITFLLANGYFEQGDDERGFEYMTKSVEHDVQAAARENRSIKTIAEQLYKYDQLDIANQLINIAYDDAKFYNARHRNLEINTLLPIINRQRIATISRQRNTLYILIVITTLLCISAIIFAWMAHRNSQIIHKSRNIIKLQLERLSTHHQLLQESNSIKEHYIVESLHKKNEQIESIEMLLRKIDVKVKNRLYDDLKYLYKDFNVKRERENFYSDFDNAFLKLFPGFIEEYNSLFAASDQLDTAECRELPTEVRIYALMRLGINDNERIARFLGLSINTVYTYKTKVKNKSVIPNEDFDSRILRIKLSAL